MECLLAIESTLGTKFVAIEEEFVAEWQTHTMLHI